MVAVAKKQSAWLEVYAVVRKIPRGRVMTYGQVASLLRRRLSPAAVGWALAVCPDDLPWHRVVNAKGGCSTDGRCGLPPGYQRALLEGEGVRFRRDGTLDLTAYRHEPAAPVGRSKPRGAAIRRSRLKPS